MILKAVVNVTLRIVVEAPHYKDDPEWHDGRDIDPVDKVVDYFLERALCSNIPAELYPKGVIATELVDTHKIHQWVEDK